MPLGYYFSWLLVIVVLFGLRHPLVGGRQYKRGVIAYFGPCAYMHAYVQYTCRHTYLLACIHVCVHTLIHAYMYTHTHTNQRGRGRIRASAACRASWCLRICCSSCARLPSRPPFNNPPESFNDVPRCWHTRRVPSKPLQISRCRLRAAAAACPCPIWSQAPPHARFSLAARTRTRCCSS